MTIKVYSNPTPTQAAQNDTGGISQVIINIAPLLSAHGIQLVENREQADIIMSHAGSEDGQADVAVCHGLMPTGMPGYPTENWHYAVNDRVIRDMIAAHAIVAPSQWVADMIQRNLRRPVTVATWGVHAENIDHTQPRDKRLYNVIWNKNRDNGVCTPHWVDTLAQDMPDLNILTTFSNLENHPSNLTITGLVPHSEMLHFLSKSLVYLATTKETGDIGSKEALAAGCPVVGFRHGALPDFITHGYNGFLVEVDDYDGLKAGITWCLEHWGEVSQNARESAQRYTWDNAAQTLADAIKTAYTRKTTRTGGVTVVIPCHNYGEYIQDAMESVGNQQTDFPFDVTIVNDGSTDDSDVIIRQTAKRLRANNPNLTDVNYIHHPKALGVAHARNAAIENTRNEYIVCLDADDLIAPTFLQTCRDALENDRTIGVAYTRLQTTDGKLSEWLAGEFNLAKQMEPNYYNEVPTCCMFRRDGWVAVGGYKQDKHPAEDADLWLRMAVYGWTPKKVTNKPLFIYRMHAGSASRTLPQQDWINGKGWIKGDCVPFGARMPKQNVYNYDVPDISVIIPVGDGHERIVADAIDSVRNQSFWNYELIVVDDTRSNVTHPLPTRYLPVTAVTTGGKGAGAARNAGIEVARGKAVLFLDADDILLAHALEKMWYTLLRTGNYVYSDWYNYKQEGGFQEREALPFDPYTIWHKGLFHTTTCLIPRQDVIDIGGFDEELFSWEDTDFFMKLIASGFCGERIAEPLLVYRMDLGERRAIGHAFGDQLKPEFYKRYGELYEGKKIVCKCRQKKRIDNSIGTDPVLVELSVNGDASRTITGKKTHTYYGSRVNGDQFYVEPEDADDHRFTIVADRADIPLPATTIPSEVKTHA